MFLENYLEEDRRVGTPQLGITFVSCRTKHESEHPAVVVI